MLKVPLSIYLALILLAAAAWSRREMPASAAEPDYFDPGGYYFPTADVVVSGFKIEWIALRTLEYYYDGALHYEKPRFLQPSARLTLMRLVDQSRAVHDCPTPTITRELLAIACPSTPIGLVSIRGTFVDKRGLFWDRKDVVSQKTVVAVATVTITRDGKDQISQSISFTYWEGD